MNTTQRKFLVEKIQEKAKLKMRELKDSKLEWPNASNFIFKAVLNDELQIQPADVILAALKERALRSKAGSDWMSGSWLNSERIVEIPIKNLLVMPADFEAEVVRVREHNEQIDAEIESLTQQLDTTEIRVQLASDKVLQSLINTVDDMGELTAVSYQLKQLTAATTLP